MNTASKPKSGSKLIQSEFTATLVKELHVINPAVRPDMWVNFILFVNHGVFKIHEPKICRSAHKGWKVISIKHHYIALQATLTYKDMEVCINGVKDLMCDKHSSLPVLIRAEMLSTEGWQFANPQFFGIRSRIQDWVHEHCGEKLDSMRAAYEAAWDHITLDAEQIIEQYFLTVPNRRRRQEQFRDRLATFLKFSDLADLDADLVRTLISRIDPTALAKFIKKNEQDIELIEAGDIESALAIAKVSQVTES